MLRNAVEQQHHRIDCWEATLLSPDQDAITCQKTTELVKRDDEFDEVTPTASRTPDHHPPWATRREQRRSGPR